MHYERLGTTLLLSATLIVGASIVADGGLGRALNGIGGIAWFAAAVFLAVAAAGSTRSPQLWAATVLLTTAVAFVIKPSDLVFAVMGFGVAGAVIVWLAPSHRLLWATLVVALYLPFHIGAAIARMVGRSIVGAEAALRTDPPPTAALVPLVMLTAALGGGLVAQRLIIRRERRFGSHLATDA